MAKIDRNMIKIIKDIMETDPKGRLFSAIILCPFREILNPLLHSCATIAPGFFSCTTCDIECHSFKRFEYYLNNPWAIFHRPKQCANCFSFDIEVSPHSAIETSYFCHGCYSIGGYERSDLPFSSSQKSAKVYYFDNSQALSLI